MKLRFLMALLVMFWGCIAALLLKADGSPWAWVPGATAGFACVCAIIIFHRLPDQD